MAVPENVFSAYVRVIGRIFPGGTGETMLYRRLTRRLSPKIKVGNIWFDARDKASESRGMRLFEKEPDTLAWINNFVNEGDVFFDVGANVGVFSLYVAKNRLGRVYAFEPEATNYEILNRNIKINTLDDSISAYCVALNSQDVISVLRLSSLEAGRSQHSFMRKTDVFHHPIAHLFSQGAIGIRGDSLVEVYGLPCPNHIKIDVDGNEDLILDGMTKVLNSTNVRSVAVEVNLNGERHMHIPKMMLGLGFKQLLDQEYRNFEYERHGLANQFFVRADGKPI